jgi:Ca-activated chloride channel family protein
MLWLLLAVPVLVGAYLLVLKRRKRDAIAVPDIGLIGQALRGRRQIRHHIPPLLFLLGLTAALIGVAQPGARITLPSMQQTVILAVDVSISMGATDVMPDRLTAAQAAAKTFIEESPSDVRIGLVAFGGNAAIVQTPTENRKDLLDAIDRFQLQRGTATGSALYTSLAALLPDAGIDLAALDFRGRAGREFLRDAPGATTRVPEAKPAEPVTPGTFRSGAIILMSDGARTTGPDPIEAANFVAQRGVRVFAIGFGTKEGTRVNVQGWSIFVRLDEATLQAIADITRGAYFHAATADDLKRVYRDLNSQLVLERRDVEITFIFAAIAAALMLVAAGLSLRWYGPALRVG